MDNIVYSERYNAEIKDKRVLLANMDLCCCFLVAFPKLVVKLFCDFTIYGLSLELIFAGLFCWYRMHGT